MVAAVRSHRAVSGVLRSGREVLRFRLQAPDRLWLRGDALGGTVVSDGRTAWIALDRPKVYAEVSPSFALALANPLVGYSLLLRNAAFDPLGSLRAALVEPGPPMRFDIKSLRNEALAQLRAAYPGGLLVVGWRERYPLGMVVGLDPATSLPTRLRTVPEPDQTTQVYRYENVVLDPPLGPADFRFFPPPDYRRWTSPVRRPFVRFLPGTISTVSARPGVWTDVQGVTLRVLAQVREYEGQWVFDFESQGRLAWEGPSAFVRIDGAWRPALFIVKDDGRAFMTFPKAGTNNPPDALQIRFGAQGPILLVEWRPQGGSSAP